MDKKLIKLIEDNHIQLHGDIEYFAELVAAAEREACATLVENLLGENPDLSEVYVAAEIRAREEE